MAKSKEPLIVEIQADGEVALKQARQIRQKLDKELSKTSAAGAGNKKQAKKAADERKKAELQAEKEIKVEREHNLRELHKKQQQLDKATRGMHKLMAKEREKAEKDAQKNIEDFKREVERKRSARLKREAERQQADWDAREKKRFSRITNMIKAEERQRKQMHRDVFADIARQERAHVARRQSRQRAVNRQETRDRLLQIRQSEIAAAKARGSKTQFLDDRGFLIRANKGRNFGKGTVKGSAASGRAVNSIFQMQQVVEDFSFAGFRGASNNLALLASQLGGTTGLIALGGLTTATLLQMSGAFDSVADSSERLKAGLAGANEELDRQRQFQMNFFGQKTTPEGFDALKDTVASQKRGVNITKSQVERLARARRIADDIERLNRRIATAESGAVSAGTGAAGTGKPGDKERARKLKLEREMKILDFRAARPIVSMDMTDEDIWGAIKAHVESITEKQKELTGELEKQTLELRDHEGELKRQSEEAERLRQLYERISNLEDEQSVAQRQRATNFDKERMHLERIKELMRDASGSDFDDVMSGDMTEEKFNRRRRERISIYNQIAAQLEQIDKTEENRRDTAESITRAAQLELSASERLVSEKSRLIKQEQQRIESLKKQAQSSQDAFGGSVFDIRMRKTREFMEKAGFSPQQIQAREDQLLGNRASLLSRQANAAGKAGDFDRQIQMLRELQQLQLSVAGSADNASRAQGALQAAEKTEQRIQQAFKQQEQQAQKNITAFTQAKQSAEKLAQQVQTLIDQSKQVDPLSDGALPKLNQYIQRLAQMQKMLAGLGGDVGDVKIPPPVKKAGGGLVPGQGVGDRTHALLEPGEVVLRKRAVKAMGLQNALALNRFGKGGEAGELEEWQKRARFNFFLSKGRAGLRRYLSRTLGNARVDAAVERVRSRRGRSSKAFDEALERQAQKRAERRARIEARMESIKTKKGIHTAPRGGSSLVTGMGAAKLNPLFEANKALPTSGGGGTGPRVSDARIARSKARTAARQARMSSRAGGGFGMSSPSLPGLDPSLGFAGSGAAIDMEAVNAITPEMQAFHDQQFALQRERLLKGKFPITPMGHDLRDPGVQHFERRSTLSRFGGGILGINDGSDSMMAPRGLVQQRTRGRQEYLRQARLAAERARAERYARLQQRSQVKNPFATGSYASGGMVRMQQHQRGGMAPQASRYNQLFSFGNVTINNEMDVQKFRETLRQAAVAENIRRGGY